MPQQNIKRITWFKEISKEDIGQVGGKGANLGEMYNMGLPIPPGFFVTAQTYKEFITKTGIVHDIKRILAQIDVEKTEDLQEKANQIQKLIVTTPVTDEIKEDIVEAYEALNTEELISKKNEIFTAVRSSATAEDLPSISEDEHVLIKIDDKPVYAKIKEIYSMIGDGDGYKIEVPSMISNKVEWRKASQIYKHKADSSILYKIKTNTGREITIAPNHSLIVLDENTLEPKTVKISELKTNAKIPTLRKIPEIGNNSPVEVRDILGVENAVEHKGLIMIKNNSTNWSIQHGLPKKINVTKEFAYFLGHYLAEGSTYKNNCISITNTNHLILNKIASYLQSLGINANNKLNKHSLRFYSPALVALLHKICGTPDPNKKGKGKLCYTKKVPDFVFSWDKTYIANFLRGCFDGDGTVSGMAVSYSTVSEMLAGGIIKLLEMLGVDCYISKKNNALYITLPRSELKKYREVIGFEDLSKLSTLNKVIVNYEAKIKHPEFKYGATISLPISEKIRQKAMKLLPQTELETAQCIDCGNKIGKSSSYKGRARYYCAACKKAYYENDVRKTSMAGYKYFDEKGRFQKNSKPWNFGRHIGKRSLAQLAKISKRYSANDLFEIFNGDIRWDEIKEITPVKYSGWVYDFTVPGVENFASGLGGIITHNSASFAGQQATYLNIKGKEKLIRAVRMCWASLFTARAIYYRVKNNFEHMKVLICVVVQKMVNADQAGIFFSVNPATNEKDEIVIEAVFGLGETAVSGAVTPDIYVVDKDDMIIKKRIMKLQKWGLFRDKEGNNVKRDIPKDLEDRQVIKDEIILKLAKYAKQLEEHYQKPQDGEWAVEKDKVYIVQTRPITTLKQKEKTAEIQGKVIVKGQTASSGVAAGPVKIVKSMKDLKKVVNGDILVAPMTNPDMVVAMKKAAAIVTDEGGITAHAAIVSREMGIPCIVGTGNATEILNDGDIVTVDATYGKVLQGRLVTEQKIKEIKEKVPTKTEIKLILDLPELAEEAAKTGADGIGLFRLEMVIGENGIHPAEYIRQNKDDEYTNMLVTKLKKVGEFFKGKPIWIRTSDIRTDEYRGLKGGAQEPKESDPMIGWHGIRRGLDEPRILKAEFMAIKKLHDKGYTNFGIMIPFVIRAEEVRKAKELLKETGIDMDVVEFGVMIETPASCWVIEDICKQGISFVSFGTNDLTQLTLGLDRNNERIAKLFDEMHPAVLGEIAGVVNTCKNYNVKTSICGQAGSRPEMAKFLAKLGIDSLAVNRDAIYHISEVIKQIESEAAQEEAAEEQPESQPEQQENTEEPQSSESESEEQAETEQQTEEEQSEPEQTEEQAQEDQNSDESQSEENTEKIQTEETTEEPDQQENTEESQSSEQEQSETQEETTEEQQSEEQQEEAKEEVEKAIKETQENE